jgi:hypothetical protein
LQNAAAVRYATPIHVAVYVKNASVSRFLALASAVSLASHIPVNVHASAVKVIHANVANDANWRTANAVTG